MRHIWQVLTAIVMLMGLVAFSTARPALAVGVVGDGTAGSCTEAALNVALAGGGLVIFNCGAAPVTIPLTSEKVIAANTQVDGGGLVTLDGQNQTRIFDVQGGVTLALAGITLERGNGSGVVLDGNGGAILIEANGIVSIARSTLRSNSAANGGAIYNSIGALTITDSTISGNTTAFLGTVNVFIGSATITNSTLSGNTANQRGGAFYNSNGTVAVTNTTITNNTATSTVAGAYQSEGSLTIQNTILANNGILSCFNVSPPLSLGGNLTDDDILCGPSLNDPTDLYTPDAQLGPLADYGGPTQTHLPQPGSPAIDAAPSCQTSEDQRGITRPQGSACDIGSVEVLANEQLPLCVNGYTGAVSTPWSGQCPPNQQELDPRGSTFCINPYTGQVQYASTGQCAPRFWTHLMPDDGALLTCVSRYTGANRAVADHSQCLAYELPNIIPATP